MDYEKIIIELLGRIQNLEEKVDFILSTLAKKEEKEIVTTDNIREYINKLKLVAKSNGKKTLVLISREIHNDLNLKSRYPMVCNAMRQCMEENDVILFQPPKGNSSTLEIEYKL